MSTPFRTLLHFLAASCLALSAITAHAQDAGTRNVAPLTDGVVIRSGPGTMWYAVGKANRQSVLRAAGEADGWIRVDYTPGMKVVVKTDEARLDEAAGKVILTQRAKIRALSSENPILDESFRLACDEFGLPGTELRFISKAKDRAGNDAGFICEPPPCAKGYVLAREVSEIKQEAPAQPAEAKPSAPAPEVVPPAATTTSLPVSTPPTSSTPSPAAQPTPAVDDPAAATPPAATPAETVAAPLETVPPPVQPAQPTGPTLRQLDRAYDDMTAGPLDASDPRELIEQYQSYANQIINQPGSERELRYIDTRIKLLRLRSDARGLLPQIQSLEDASRNAAQNYALTIDKLIERREYLVAGRLYPSTVYDGERLPLMYRLVSIDPAIGRTLAYIVPDPNLQLEQKVGAIVGILGDGTIEPSSLVQIIKPTVVDVLRHAEPLPPDVVR